MLKKILTCLCIVLCVLSVNTTVYAFTPPGPKVEPPVVKPTEPGPGGGEDPGPPAEPKEPSILSYTPVVTALHSANAAFANQDNLAVYFLPRLEDFPVDLPTTCADVTTDDGVQHKFALVYDGYFNNEVEYLQGTADAGDTTDVTRFMTSKKVYSMTDNSRTLNLLGYDLLLSREDCTIVNKGDGWLSFEYNPTLVGDAPLTTKTIVMDLYKAVGAWEWDIKLTYGIDETLAVNTSPIMQQIAVLTNDEIPGGINVSEGATWVWATRTNPDLYWERCNRDAIFDGGAHLYTKSLYVGNDVSVTFSKNENDTMSMAEFCSVARAIMELYGEPVLTETEKTYMMQAFAMDLPTSHFDAEQKEDIEYLAAKGIIDPSTINFAEEVTFADIEELLLRIADKDSRLVFDIPVNFSSYMVQEGFVEAPISTTNIEVQNIEEITNPFDCDTLDYFIEAVDGCTNFYLRKLSGLEREERRDGSDASPPVASIHPGSSEYEETTDYVFACNKLIVNTDTLPPTTSGSGYFTYNGMVKVYDKYYYHFRINKNLSSITISYDYDPETETLDTLKEYTLPNALGGVYNYSGGYSYQTFDEAGFSDYYLDRDRVSNDYYGLAETESYLSSSYQWYSLVISSADFTKSKLKDCGLDLNRDGNLNGSDILFVDLLDNSGKPIKSPLESKYNGSPLMIYVHDSPAGATKDVYNVIVQVRMSPTDFNKCLILSTKPVDSSSTTAYYRHSDNTLLVSYNFLKTKGLVSGLVKLDDGIALIDSSTGNNIVLRDDLNIIMIGDTVYSGEGQILYRYVSSNELYINYKACIGWTSNYLVLNQDSQLLPVLGSTSRMCNLRRSVKSVNNLYPTSSYNVGYLKAIVSKTNYEGFTLATSNALGSYMLVNDGLNDLDYLFVWHRQDVKDSSGNIHHYDDSDARSKFKDLTGISVGSVSDNYGLLMYTLNRKSPSKGFKYITDKYKTKYSEGTYDVGWVYTPPSYSDWNKALDAYVAGNNQVLPIAKVGGKYINLNMNTCSDLPDSEQLPIGMLPYSLQYKSNATNDTLMGKINSSGNVVDSGAVYDTLDQAVIYSAPVGVFQQIKGLGTKELGKTNGSNFFFGSSKAKYVKDHIVINDMAIEANDSTPAVCALRGLGNNSIWVVNTEKTSLLASIEDLASSINVMVTEPDNLIDWGAYKFGRLVKNIDDWSSIALIFVLNVLPRVGMILFFVLMLLSMVKNVKPWRIFCERVFDVYSFLTFGKQNVNTVDTRRVLFISLICFSLFLIVMDGALFNFIIWVCRWFIILFQR